MKSLFVLLCVVGSIGYWTCTIGVPAPDPESPMCVHEDCIRLRSPSAPRDAQGSGEISAYRYRADTPPESRPKPNMRHPVKSWAR